MLTPFPICAAVTPCEELLSGLKVERDGKQGALALAYH